VSTLLQNMKARNHKTLRHCHGSLHVTIRDESVLNLSISILCPWSRVIFQKLLVTQLVRLHNSPPLIPILSNMNLVHTFPSSFPKVSSNFVLPTTPKSPEFSLS
jgi:hypothetical protein